MKKIPELAYNDESHSYTRGSKVYHSVTKVTGLLTDFSTVPPAVLQQAQVRGTAVHTLTELYDEKGDRLKISAEHRQFVGYLTAYKRFRKDYSDLKIHSTELMISCEKPCYAGRLDRIYSQKKDLTLTDFKSSVRRSWTWDLQLAAYKRAFNLMFPKTPIKDRLVVQLNKLGVYSLVREEDMIPYEACLEIFDTCLEELDRRTVFNTYVSGIKKKFHV